MVSEIERLVQKLYFKPPSAIYRYRDSINAMIPADSTHVFVQAYGRRAYPDEGLFSVLSIIRQAANWDELRAFELLQSRPDPFDGGLSNNDLADTTFHLTTNYDNLTIVAQWEICYQLFRIHPRWYQNYGKIVCLWPDDRYFATKDVKKKSLASLADPRSAKVIELAHPEQLVRATTILWKLGLQVWPYVSDIRYDPASIQIWTRNKYYWFCWEETQRIVHPILGWSTLRPPAYSGAGT